MIEKDEFEKARFIEMEEDEDSDNPYELEFDVDDAIVQVIDGILIDGDEEEIKLLFYYIKPGENLDESLNIKCKAIAEFRISRTRFLEIGKRIRNKLKDYRKYQKNLEDFMFV